MNMGIRFEIEQILKLGLGPQQEKWYRDYLEALHEVEVVPLSEVMTDEELTLVKECLEILPKQCYRNAHLLTLMFPKDCQYVEGKVMLDIGLSIDHAWNKFRGKYVDVTFELALKDDVTKSQYAAVGEWDLKVIHDVTSETGMYGEIYKELYIKKNC